MKNLNNYKIFILIFISWIFYLGAIYYFSNFIKGGNFANGYKTGNDSSRYINSANEILNGDFSNFKIIGYVFYEIFLSLIFFFNKNLFFVVLVQSLVTFLSGVLIFRITKKLYNFNAGILAMILFLFSPDIQMRNFYILTDIFYINLMIISFYFFFFNKNILLTCLFIIFIILVRPHGIIFIFFLFFILGNRYLKYLSKLVKYLLLCLLFVIFILFLNTSLIYVEDKLGSLINIYKYIIYEYDYMPFLVPKDLPISNNINISLQEFLILIIKYPLFFFKIFITKLLFFLFRLKPYYSDAHNLYLLLSTGFLYVLSSISLFYLKVNKKFYQFFYFLLIGTCISVIITSLDWSGRFYLPLLPFLYMLTGMSLSYFNILIKNKYKN